MPTYDYKCEKCGEEMEIVHSITSDGPRTCPKCGEEALKRLISGGSGVKFVGSGFYENDYKRSQIPAVSTKKDDGVSMGNKTSTDGGVKRK